MVIEYILLVPPLHIMAQEYLVLSREGLTIILGDCIHLQLELLECTRLGAERFIDALGAVEDT